MITVNQIANLKIFVRVVILCGVFLILAVNVVQLARTEEQRISFQHQMSRSRFSIIIVALQYGVLT